MNKRNDLPSLARLMAKLKAEIERIEREERK